MSGPRQPRTTGSGARRLATREVTVLALIAALVTVSRLVFHLPLHVPGHSGLYWMALMVIGRGVVRRPGAGTLLGFVAGVLAVLFTPGRLGLLTWVDYLAPGVMLDVLAPLIRERFADPVLGTLAGAFANLAKLLTSFIVTLAMGIPAGFVAVGLGPSAVSHTVFGALGGFIGALVLRRLPHARLPQTRGLQPEKSDAS